MSKLLFMDFIIVNGKYTINKIRGALFPPLNLIFNFCGSAYQQLISYIRERIFSQLYNSQWRKIKTVSKGRS